MTNNAPDFFGYVPTPKPQKSKNTAKTAAIPHSTESLYPVYGPHARPTRLLGLSVFAFFLWYVFGAKLSVELRELSEPLYGAIAFCALVVGLIWFTISFVDACLCHFRADPNRRAIIRYRSRTKAWIVRGSIGVASVSLILFGTLLAVHGYWNARTVAIAAYEKLNEPPKLSEEQVEVASGPPTKSEAEQYGPPAPQKGPPQTTGSVTKRKSTPKNASEKVDPLAKAFQDIGQWFERNFGTNRAAANETVSKP